MTPKIPLANWIDILIRWMEDHLGTLFGTISSVIEFIVSCFTWVFMLPHPLLFIAILAIISYGIGRLPLTLFTVIGFLLVDNLGYWTHTMNTLGLVITSALLSVIFGIPIGIWCAYSKTLHRIVSPVLDFMQTMPAFVYLLPAVSFFSIGVVPGVIASVIFAIPPTIRLTYLGIKQVSSELEEAADAFGSTSWQKLFKVELPLAKATMMAGVNQTIMLSLSMVVISSMIGAEGVGAEVYRAVTQLKIGQGFEAGLAVVVLAIVLDRFTQNLFKSDRKKVAVRNVAGAKSPKYSRKVILTAACFAVILVGGIIQAAVQGSGQNANAQADATGEVGPAFNYQIIGIDPGAGIMKSTAQVLTDYDLKDWKLVESSSAAMTATLDKAIRNEEPVIITGWTPHWMFTKYDLKYLDDPKKTYGESEGIHTIVRLGLKEDQPEAYQFLQNFNWTSDEMGEIMIAIQDGKDASEAASTWAEAHPERVNEWTKGITPVQGNSIKLSYVAWDSEIASTHLISYILEQKLGFKVTALQVEAGPMWTAVANGDVDATIAAWLPLTHGDYWDKFKDQIEDLGANMTGVRTGLVVPAYVDIDSIEDLNK